MNFIKKIKKMKRKDKRKLMTQIMAIVLLLMIGVTFIYNV